jgi:serine/threonine protein kinase/ribosomal protein S27E
MSTRSHNSDRVDAALAEYMARIDNGEQIDVTAFLARYSDIAAELRAFLENDASLAKAVQSTQTVAFADSRTPSRSRGLQIRCPHCSNHVELLVDTPYEDISCHSCGSVFNLVDREEQTRLAAPLKTIGRFELISRLGVGGFGSVWKARDKELDRVVAIKIPRKGQLSADEIDQFFKEARAAAQLRHPHIVPVHEVGRDGDTIFIVCDLIRGVDLSDWLTAARPSARESAALCATIARALHHAHQAKVIHRDLKPSNVMIDAAGDPHLMDFGLAKREVGEITMTVDGQLLGTPAYMSPEQAAGQSHWTDRRTDIYSLGVVMYRMISGELPFRGNAQMQVYQRLTDDPPDPRKLNRHIPRDLATICLKCLERDPNRRYATAAALAEELDRFLQGAPILARPLSRPARAARWARRNPWLAATAALGAILAVGGPAAALKINADRARAEDDRDKYHRLVDQYGAEKSSLNAEKSDLQRRVDLLSGSANPWTTWALEAELGPRREFLNEVYSRHFAESAKRLGAGTMPAWDAAVGRLGLGTLAYVTAHREEAVEQFAAAEKLLRALVAERPDDATYVAALAACCESQSLLAFEKEPGVAREKLNEASSLYERLMTLDGGQKLRHLVDRAEAEFRSAASNEDKAVEHARIAMAEKARFIGDWPQDPIAAYELIMHLVQDEAAGAKLAPPADGRNAPSER